MNPIVESAVHWTTSSYLKGLKKLARKGEPMWMSKSGTLVYTWDSFHGEIEVFKLKGNVGYHRDVLDADGKPHKTKRAIRGRTIHV